jgi:hypothetical protein
LQACLEEIHEIDEELVSLFSTNEQLENVEQVKTREMHHAVANGMTNIVNLDNVTNSKTRFRSTAETGEPDKIEPANATVKGVSAGLETFTAVTPIDSNNAYEDDLSLSVYDVQSAYNDALYNELHETAQASYDVEIFNKEERGTNKSNAGAGDNIRSGLNRETTCLIEFYRIHQL